MRKEKKRKGNEYRPFGFLQAADLYKVGNEELKYICGIRENEETRTVKQMSTQEHPSDPDHVAEAVELNANENESEVNFSTGRGVSEIDEEDEGTNSDEDISVGEENEETNSIQEASEETKSIQATSDSQEDGGTSAIEDASGGEEEESHLVEDSAGCSDVDHEESEGNLVDDEFCESEESAWSKEEVDSVECSSGGSDWDCEDRDENDSSKSWSDTDPSRLEISQFIPVGTIEDFIGENESVQQAKRWLMKFEYVAGAVRWNGRQRRLSFQLHLRGGAAQWFSQLDQRVKRVWSKLKGAFLKRFCRQEYLDAQFKYYTAMCKQNESPREFLDRLNGLATKANIKYRTSQSKAHVIQYIASLREDGLSDLLALYDLPDVKTLERRLATLSLGTRVMKSRRITRLSTQQKDINKENNLGGGQHQEDKSLYITQTCTYCNQVGHSCDTCRDVCKACLIVHRSPYRVSVVSLVKWIKREWKNENLPKEIQEILNQVNT